MIHTYERYFSTTQFEYTTKPKTAKQVSHSEQILRWSGVIPAQRQVMLKAEICCLFASILTEVSACSANSVASRRQAPQITTVNHRVA